MFFLISNATALVLLFGIFQSGIPVVVGVVVAMFGVSVCVAMGAVFHADYVGA